MCDNSSTQFKPNANSGVNGPLRILPSETDGVRCQGNWEMSAKRNLLVSTQLCLTAWLSYPVTSRKSVDSAVSVSAWKKISVSCLLLLGRRNFEAKVSRDNALYL